MPYVLPDGRRVAPERAFDLDGIQYPRNWLKFSTEADRSALNITWEADPPAPEPPPPTKDQLLAQSAAKRWEIETGGITVNGTPVPTDERTRGVLTAGYVKATADANYQITDWKVGPGVYTTLDAATIIAMANAVEAHVQACFSANKAVDIKINDDTYTTYAQVNEAAEWPVV